MFVCACVRQASFKFLSGLERAVGGEGGGEALLGLVECVHGPFCQLLVRYPAMETHLLKQQLQTVNLVCCMCDSVFCNAVT